MAKEKLLIHPYIPNSVPAVREEMLEFIGVESAEELYKAIPERLRLKRKLNLPEAILSECELEKHVISMLAKNKPSGKMLNFLGGGCWQHYVPAVCDEIAGRSEFLTAYVGEAYSDLGKYQAFFEFASQMGELLNMDVVSLPTYSWGSAAGNALRMASRMLGRHEVLLPKTISPERLAVIENYCQPAVMPGHIDLEMIGYNSKTGLLDLEDLKNKISSRTAAVYFENPSYLGFIESEGEEIAKIAHANGTLSIVGVDPISLGVLVPPADYGADIVVGTAQPLGIHMYCGGGTIGFVASRDEKEYVAEYPSLLISIANTIEEGEYGFGECLFERTSYEARDKAKDWVGTATGLWTIAAAVYMALMGPNGFREIGETIIQRSHYTIRLLAEIETIQILFSGNSFKEFVVNFDASSRSVEDINKALLEYDIFGGKDLSREFPELGNSALYCVTEMHSQEDIKTLANALKEVLSK